MKNLRSSEWLWETCWQLWPAVRKETSLKKKANEFPISIFLCSSPASAQPNVSPFSRQLLKAEASLSSITLVNDFAWEQSMMQGKDVTAAVLAATDSLFNLILFLLVLLYLFTGPRSTRLELNEKPKGVSVSVNAIFFSLEAKHKANCSPEFLKLSSTYETTLIIFIRTFFSPNTLVLQVLQPLFFFPKT